MAINKVIYNNRTLIDVSQDTVTSSTLAVGATATAADGSKITGRLNTDALLDILQQPEDCVFTLGSDATCSLVAQGTGLSYNWQYAWPDAPDTWIDFSAARNGKPALTYGTNDARYQGIKCRCIVTDSNGNSIVSRESVHTYRVAPKMDGTASAGTAGAHAYAYVDHIHPTDTSRAAASDLNSLKTTVSEKQDKITVSESEPQSTDGSDGDIWFVLD